MGLISIGIDQSYENTGWCINKDGKPYEWGSIKPPSSYCHSERRKYIFNGINKVILKSLSEVNLNPNRVILVFERIRLRSQGFLSLNYIIKTAGLIAGIIDICYEHGIKVYSVDTRSWKSKVIGTSKPLIKEVEITKGKNKGKIKKIKDTKYYTVKYVNEELNIEESDDNICDSICISIYPFLRNTKSGLRKEG